MAIASNAALVSRYKPVFVPVKLQGALTRGLLVYGNDIYRGQPTSPLNARICVQASAALFKQQVFALLSAN